MTRFAALSFCILLLAAIPAHAQQEPVPQNPLNPQSAVAPPTDGPEQKVMREMARQRNVQRQKEIVADANRLLDLAKKLKTEVDKSNKNQLSLSVVDTANQIEKLARSVKERMRDGT